MQRRCAVPSSPSISISATGPSRAPGDVDAAVGDAARRGRGRDRAVGRAVGVAHGEERVVAPVSAGDREPTGVGVDRERRRRRRRRAGVEGHDAVGRRSPGRACRRAAGRRARRRCRRAGRADVGRRRASAGGGRAAPRCPSPTRRWPAVIGSASEPSPAKAGSSDAVGAPRDDRDRRCRPRASGCADRVRAAERRVDRRARAPSSIASTARKSNSETPENANVVSAVRLGGGILRGRRRRRDTASDSTSAPAAERRMHHSIRSTVDVLPSEWRNVSFTSPTPGAKYIVRVPLPKAWSAWRSFERTATVLKRPAGTRTVRCPSTVETPLTP